MVISARPRINAPAPRIGFGLEPGILAALGILAVAVSLSVALGQSHQFDSDKWYAMTAVEGVASYMSFATEEACRTATSGVDAACVAGAELNS
ncbi:MAG: hypothetical protein ABI702_19610 [Burkholderiales bacterium]